MENKFAERLNRGAQSVTRRPDFIDQLAVIRVVANSNQSQSGEIITSIGRKTQDDSFTAQVQYWTNMGGVRSIRLVFPGMLAEQAVKDKLNKGVHIKFTGLVQAHVDQLGQIDRRPYCVVEAYTVVPVSETGIPGAEKL